MGTVVCRFASYDSKRCLGMAWQWIRLHPTDALILSCDHVLDLYAGRTYPWPSFSNAGRLGTMVWEKLSLVLITLPALIVAAFCWRGRSPREHQALVVLTLPMVCLWLTVFLTSGEPRYRVPFDAFAIVLAAMGYHWIGGGRKADRPE